MIDEEVLKLQRKLDLYRSKMRDIRDLEKERKEIKQEFLLQLKPGIHQVGNYSVTNKMISNERLMSSNHARLELLRIGYNDVEIARIISSITKTGESQQFIVKYNPIVED